MPSAYALVPSVRRRLRGRAGSRASQPRHRDIVGFETLLRGLCVVGCLVSSTDPPTPAATSKTAPDIAKQPLGCKVTQAEDPALAQG